MREWFEDAFGRFYSEVYSHRDEKEASIFARLLRNVIPLENRSVLDVCCGSGRHLRALEKEGARVLGLDLSEQMLGSSQRFETEFGSRVVRGDMRALPFKGDSFDVCLNMFTSLGYFGKRESELLVLNEVHRVLRREGTFIVDHLNREWVRKTLKPFSTRVTGDLLVEERRTILMEETVVEKTTRICSAGDPARVLKEYTERVTLFDEDELVAMLRSAAQATRSSPLKAVSPAKTARMASTTSISSSVNPFCLPMTPPSSGPLPLRLPIA
ncbi:MAG: class I SAM-dependent methyltransferase [Candidatus Eisenbacteria bacterium]